MIQPDASFDDQLQDRFKIEPVYQANRAPLNISPDLVIAGCPVRACMGVGSAHCSLRMQERVGRVIQARSELCTTRTLKYRSAVDPRV